jgi:hypothetical protein
MEASGSRALSLGQRSVRRSTAALTSSGHSHARPEHLHSSFEPTHTQARCARQDPVKLRHFDHYQNVRE